MVLLNKYHLPGAFKVGLDLCSLHLIWSLSKEPFIQLLEDIIKDSGKGQVAFCRNMQTLEIYRTMHVLPVSTRPGNELNRHEINAPRMASALTEANSRVSCFLECKPSN